MRASGRGLALLVATTLLAAACSGTGDEPEETTPPASDTPASGEISFLLFGDPEELAAYRNVVEAFKDVEPDVTVNLIEASDRDDLLARLSTSFAGGTPPDLFLLNYRFYGQFAARGVLESIESRVDGSEAFQQEDFYPEAMDAFRFDGELTCLPQNISSLVVYFNRDLFRAAGLPDDPPEGWTWNRMVEMAKTMTLDNDGDGAIDQFGLGVEASIIRVAPFIWSNGGELVDDEANPTRFAVDSPEAIAALQDFFDLFQVHQVVPSDVEVESEADEDRFLNGRMAMLLSSRRDTPLFRTITDFDWDIAPLPSMGQPAGILHSDAYCMTTGSENKEAAWRFMEFALGPEGQRITAASGRTVPSLIEVANSDAFLDPTAMPAHSQVFLETIPVIRRVPNISTWPEIEDVAGGILEQGMYEGLSAEEAAQRLIAETEDIFARAEG